MTRLAVIVVMIAVLSACGGETSAPDAAAEPTDTAVTTGRPTSQTAESTPPHAPERERRRPVPLLVEDRAGRVPDDLERLAAAFVRYAVEEADTLPHADSVTFALGGQVAKAVDDIAAALPNRNVWKTCPADWDYYGASDCPVNFLGPVVSAAVNRTGLVVTSEPGRSLVGHQRPRGP